MAIGLRGRALPCVLGAAALFVTSAASATPTGTVIDNFSQAADSWLSPQTNVGSSWIFETGLTSVLDGRRKTSIAAFELDTLGVDSIVPSIDEGLSNFDYLASSGALGAVTLRYGLNTVDLSANFSGDLGISVVFDAYNGGDVPVTVKLIDEGTTLMLTKTLSGAGPQTLFFEFADFAGIDTIDLDSLNVIAVHAAGGKGSHFEIGQIASFSTIPMPGALALFGAAALLGRRRRRA